MGSQGDPARDPVDGPAFGAADWPAVFELLERVWPRLATAIPTSARLGARWQEMSTPFIVKASIVVSNEVHPLVAFGLPFGIVTSRPVRA